MTFGDHGRLLARLLRETLSPTSLGALLRPAGARRWLLLLLFVPAFLGLQLLHWVGLLLDEVLFPGYRRVEVREPLFVVGLPRSGTSYLQRVLAGDEERFTTLRLWELLLAPSITERRIWLALAGLDRLLGRPGRWLVRGAQSVLFQFMDDVHPVDLGDPEEDYLLLLPAFACFLLVVPFPYHPAVWKLTRFDQLDEPVRVRIVELYRSCVQRHLYVVGDDRRLLSKNPSFTPMIASLHRAFPDARWICCLRDPVEVVPSLLSSLEDGARIFGWSIRTPELRGRFVDMLEHFAGHAMETLSALPDDRHAFLPLPSLRQNVRGAMMEVYRRFGWSSDPAFREHLDRETKRARAHRSRHDYSLSGFGLSEEDMVERFAPLRARFDLAGEAPE